MIKNGCFHPFITQNILISLNHKFNLSFFISIFKKQAKGQFITALFLCPNLFLTCPLKKRIVKRVTAMWVDHVLVLALLLKFFSIIFHEKKTIF